jgi:2-dehydropantoate 2-reductase
MNIAVLGCGGVGGYYGSKLAYYYSGHPSVNIIFLARGKHLEKMQESGLVVCIPGKEFTVRPFLATEAFDGTFDLVLVAVKTYDLPAAIGQIRKNITAVTIIIPLVNGVEAYELLRQEFPASNIFQGCCYLNSLVEAPGIIRFMGGSEQVQLGFHDEALLGQTAELLSAAGLDVFSGKDISDKVWEKFLFGSVFSAIGSLQNETFGEIASSPERMKLARKMLTEANAVAQAKGINLRPSIADDILVKIRAFSKDARSSMQQDFAKGKRTELETFVGYIIRCGKELKIETPEYLEIYEQLNKR